MIIGDRDLGGASNPFLAPVAGTDRGDVLVYNAGHLAYPKGAVFRDMPVKFWVRAWQGMGGQPANSFLAAQLFIKQLEELASNSFHNPTYIRWSSTADPTGYNAADPHDGWYEIVDFKPNYASFIPSGWVECSMKATLIAPGPPRSHAIAQFGGQLQTAATLPGGFNALIAAHPNATLLRGTSLRTSADGNIPFTFNPPNPERVLMSAAVSDWFKGRVRIFDTLGSSANPVPATLMSDGFESAASQPGLQDPAGTYFYDSFETAGTTQTMFRSVGTDATGTLTYWTQLVGSWSIASNVVTGPGTNNAIMGAGHPDWTDGTYLLRFKWVTSSVPRAVIHWDGSNNYIFGQCDGTNVTIQKTIAGTITSVASQAAALTNGNQYWLKVIASGTTYSAAVFNDSSGSVGTQVGSTASGTISDAGVQSGKLGIGSGSTTGTTFGGAFAGVCTWSATAPTGAYFGQWIPTVNAGEPAFAWSTKQSYYGTHSLSIYSPAAGGQGYWNTTIGDGMSGITALWSEALWVSTGASPTVGMNDAGGNYANGSGAATADSTWHLYSHSFAAATNSLLMLQYGAGTMYIDNVAIVNVTGVTPANVLFRSLGTDATGTLTYWTQDSGAWSIASNVASSPASAARMHAGHPDTTDCVLTVRFNCPNFATGGPEIGVRGSGTNSVRVIANGSSLFVYTEAGGISGSNFVQTATGTLVNSSWYWLRLQATGQVFTASLYADLAGTIGPQLASVSSIGAGNQAVFTDASVGSGYFVLANHSASTGASQFGGAFANVMMAVGPLPLGWTPATTAGEPAYAWSRTQVHGGTYSLSVFNAASGAQGVFNNQINGAIPNASITASGWLRGTGSPTSFIIGVGALGAGPPTIDSTFHQVSATGTPSGGNFVQLIAYGSGTFYFDDLLIQTANAGSFVNPNWLEVFAPDHQFTGDVVMTNGLLLLFFQVGAGYLCTPYLWSTGLGTAAWQPPYTVVGEDNATFAQAVKAITPQRVGPEECAVVVVGATSQGQEDEIVFRLQRGHFECRFEPRPLTQANATVFRYFLAPTYPLKVGFTSAGPRDYLVDGFGQPAQPLDYFYGGTFTPTAAAPYMSGWLAQGATGQVPADIGDGQLNFFGFGDATGPTQGQTRSYAFFGVPFGTSGSFSAQYLQVEAEAGISNSTGPFVVASDFGASALSAMKLPSGNVNANNQFPVNFPNGSPLFTPPPGTYLIFARVRQGQLGAGVNGEVFLFGYNATTAVISAGATLTPAGLNSTTYKYVSLGTVAVAAGQSISAYIKANGTFTTTVDWYVDEIILVPLSLTTDFRAPQDIFQNYIDEIIQELVVA